MNLKSLLKRLFTYILGCNWKLDGKLDAHSESVRDVLHCQLDNWASNDETFIGDSFIMVIYRVI